MNAQGLFWIIFSYLLGSIPFGYLISRPSGKNILEIGWKKTSGSNVFKNVGKWQGILTGVLDLAKGYLAVYGAQRFGFSSEIQVFSGVAAVIGHNWSLFLKLSGGRGIGTFGGVILALSPQIFWVILIPIVVFAIIWTSAIGTIISLVLGLIFSFYLKQFETAGVFILIVSLFIFIKRLSPVSEIFSEKEKKKLIINRLLFDNDQFISELRIKKIFPKIWQGTKYASGKAKRIIKPIAWPLMLPPKFGWEVAKFGVKMAKKPIEMLISRTPEKIVTEIGIEDLKNMTIASAKKIVLHQEEINKINVFPVADKDTGYNLAATLLGIEGTIALKKYSTIRELAKDIKEAALVNARGNVGMIYTGYLIEFLDKIKHLEKIEAFHFALAMKKGIAAARKSIIIPTEGTILDVIDAAGEKAYEVVKIKKEKNIIKILDEAYRASEISLKETKEKLQVLKENNVVDAGGLGFLKILEAWLENLKGLTPALEPEATSPFPQIDFKEELKHPYEVILILKKTKETNVEDLKKEISSRGDSLDILESEEKIKIHIHTNQPEFFRERFQKLDSAELKIENVIAEKSPSKKPIGLVVDEIADLPKEFLKSYDIEEVFFKTMFPDGEVVTSKEEIFIKMRGAIKFKKPLPITSVPSFGDFLSAYQESFKKFEKILVITVSSKLSGTYSSARIARSIFKKPEKLNIYVFDCFTGEVGEGLVAVKTQELISQGKKIEEIINYLKEFCPKITLFICFEDFRYIVHGGRVKLPKILLGPISLIQKIGIQPLVVLKNGRVKFSGIRFGRNAADILANEIEKNRKGQEIRVAIAHADNLKIAEELKLKLEKKPKVKVLFISSVSPVVGTHTGPGTIIVAFYPVDNDF